VWTWRRGPSQIAIWVHHHDKKESEQCWQLVGRQVDTPAESGPTWIVGEKIAIVGLL
jgi:NADPH-dependent ferric siderophore reductase